MTKKEHRDAARPRLGPHLVEHGPALRRIEKNSHQLRTSPGLLLRYWMQQALLAVFAVDVLEHALPGNSFQYTAR